MENRKRKYDQNNTCKSPKKSIYVISDERLYEKSVLEKELNRKESSEENENSSGNESDSDKNSVTVDNQSKEIYELQEWIANKNVPHEHIDDLLKILRHRLLPNLPERTETLLKYSVQNIDVSNESSEVAETENLENSSTDPTFQMNFNHSIFNSIDRVSNDNQLQAENIFNPLDIPIIEIQNEGCTSDFQKNVLLQLSEIHKNITFLKQRQEDMINFLIDKKAVSSLDGATKIDFYKRYQFKLPLDNMESFLQFDVRLKTDKFLLNDVCTELQRLVDKDYSITKSYVQMLKKFLSKNVALQFTAVRQSRQSNDTKKLFKPTEFCKCMDAAITHKRSNTALLTTDSMLIKGLSDVLCNVKKWNKTK